MKTLKDLIKLALHNNAKGISIEYKDGYEELCVLKGNVGIELEKMKSNSDQSKSLFDELATIEKQGYMVIDDQRIYLEVEVYDNFGEEAYKMTILDGLSNLVH